MVYLKFKFKLIETGQFNPNELFILHKKQCYQIAWKNLFWTWCVIFRLNPDRKSKVSSTSLMDNCWTCSVLMSMNKKTILKMLHLQGPRWGKTFIVDHKHRNPENTKFTKLVKVRNFELKVFRHEERETQSFYANCFYIVSSQPNQHAAPVAHKVVWPRPGRNLSSLVRTQELNSLLFLKSPNSSAHTSGHDVIQLLGPIFYLGFYFDICEWRILPKRAWTPPLMFALN